MKVLAIKGMQSPMSPHALFLPGHAPLQELFTSEVVAREALGLGETLLDDRLSRDTGVVVAGDEEGRETAHAVPADVECRRSATTTSRRFLREERRTRRSAGTHQRMSVS